MPTTVVAASLHAASQRLQQDRQLPREQKLTGQSLATGASAAGLGSLHMGSLPAQSKNISAVPSMAGLGTSLGQDGHAVKRQKTSESEEVGSLSARMASSGRPVQAATMDSDVTADLQDSEQVSLNPIPSYTEGACEAASTHRGNGSKPKEPCIPAHALAAEEPCAAHHDPAVASAQSTSTHQRDMPVQGEAAGRASAVDLSAASCPRGPPTARASPQCKPQRCASDTVSFRCAAVPAGASPPAADCLSLFHTNISRL